MDLNERIIAELRESEQAIEALCGAQVKYEVAWGTFADDEIALRNIDRISSYPVKRAVQLICREEMAKAAVRDGLKGVRLVNVANETTTRLVFHDGVLEIQCSFATSAAPGWQEIREVLEKAIDTQPSASYTRFLKSMFVGLEEWREGTGYDLDALNEMTPAERVSIEAKLIEHLADPGDWRDVEALAALGTPNALSAVEKARKHRDRDVRNWAIEHGLENASDNNGLENDVVRAVRQGAIELAEQCPTPRVKRALLDCARTADATTRVNAAALLMYLCGQAAERFDWSRRPFFLRFGEDDPKERRSALQELRKKTGL